MKIPQPVFKRSDRLINDVIWAGKRPGMSMEDYAVQTCIFITRPLQIVHLFSTKAEKPLWADLENDINKPFKALDHASQHPNEVIKLNPIIMHTRSVWHRMHNREKVCPFVLDTSTV